MSKELDDKYHRLALEALHRGLVGHELQVQIGDEETISTEVLRAFEFSGDILRNNQESQHVRMVADTVFETCIRLARCLYFSGEARTLVLHENEHILDAESQLVTLRRNMSHLKTLLDNG